MTDEPRAIRHLCNPVVVRINVDSMMLGVLVVTENVFCFAVAREKLFVPELLVLDSESV